MSFLQNIQMLKLFISQFLYDLLQSGPKAFDKKIIRKRYWC